MKRGVYAGLRCQGAPHSASSSHGSLKSQHRHRENASADPVGCVIQNKHIEQRDENNPCRTTDQHDCAQYRQGAEAARGHRHQPEYHDAAGNDRF